MSIDIVLKLESDQAMHEYLMNHSYLYKELNRDPDYFEWRNTAGRQNNPQGMSG